MAAILNPVLSHVLIALCLTVGLTVALRALHVRRSSWHAAGAASLYLFARESAQAERALLPVFGDPYAYFWTLWPGNWTAGGHISEWLIPSAAAIAAAALASWIWPDPSN